MKPRIEVVALVSTAGDEGRERGIALFKVDGKFVQHLAVERRGDGGFCVAPAGAVEHGNVTYEAREREDWLRFADLASDTRALVAKVVTGLAEAAT